MATQVPKLEAIANATLKNLSTTGHPDIVAKSLWESSPAVIVAFRRPGCILCRDEARKIWSLKQQFDTMGVRVVGLVHENIPAEISDFHPAFWPGELYFDEQKTFYKALGNGKVVRGSLMSFLNPFGSAWKAVSQAKKNVDKSNLNGDGLTMGGLFVVKKGDAGVQFMHVEKTFGLHAPSTVVLQEAALAAGK